MAVEKIIIEISDEALNDAVAKADEALQQTETKATTITGHINEIQDETDDRLTGTMFAARRLTAMIPGLHEAYSLISQIRLFLRVSPQIAALLLMVMAIRVLQNILAEQEKTRKEYESLIREYRGFTTHAQFVAWQETQRKNQESYRSQPIP